MLKMFKINKQWYFLDSAFNTCLDFKNATLKYFKGIKPIPNLFRFPL